MGSRHGKATGNLTAMGQPEGLRQGKEKPDKATVFFVHSSDSNN